MRRVLSVAFAATVVHSRPTNDEWKEGQKAAADDKAAAAANEAKMAAVNKVVTMMEDLHEQVVKEGEEEERTYHKFDVFCQDTTSDKTDAIKKGRDLVSELSATIETLEAKIEDLKEEIKNLLADLDGSATRMKEAKAERAVTLKVYEKNAADLQAGLDGLDAAIRQLKASKKPSLVQLQGVSTELKSALSMADTLGFGSTSSRKVISLLQGPDVPMEDYKFHSGDIIETLEQLEKKFRDTKAEVDEEEVKSVAVFDSLMQKETDYTKAKNHDLDKAKKHKEHKIAKLAETNEELATAEAILADDKQYLKELTKMCEDKAKTYKQRSAARHEELEALSAATDIVKGSVSEKTSSSTIRFAQQAVRVRIAEAVARSPEAMEAVEAEAEAVEGPVSFLQQSSHRGFLARMAPADTDGGRDVVLSLLRSRGQQLHSTLLASLASRIAADPFAKIKNLIQELIDRLLKEAADEANQKGFCDKATADAEQKRDYAAQQIAELNSELASEEARRDTLTEELDTLRTEIDDLNTKRKEAQKVRDEEHAENEHTVMEATAGLDAVKQAIQILDRFYKANAKNKVDLSLAQGPLDDAPATSFDTGDAYKGAGGESGGIIGMLDVIKSDFERTISQTQKAEEEAAADHLAFKTDTGMSLAEKTMAEKQKTTQREDALEKIGVAQDSLDSESATLKESLQELLKLKPMCVDTGMSYEERVARREDEIESLKKALCILEAYAEYGPDGLGGAC